MSSIHQQSEQLAVLELPSVDSETKNNETIVLGTISNFDRTGRCFVTFPGGENETLAQSSVQLDKADLGKQAALTFLDGSKQKPLVLGLIQNPTEATPSPVTATVDGKRMTLSGSSEVLLKCGKASILLTAEGKIVLKGTHLVSRSTGPNKIKGASVSIN